MKRQVTECYCDRCGASCEIVFDVPSLTAVGTFKRWCERVLGDKPADDVHYVALYENPLIGTNRPLDLCQRCKDSLREWWDNGAQVEVL